MELKIRLPAVAGTFYPGTKRELKSLVEELLQQAQPLSGSKKMPGGLLRGLIVPHAGYIYSGVVAAAGFNLVKKYYQRSRTPSLRRSASRRRRGNPAKIVPLSGILTATGRDPALCGGAFAVTSDALAMTPKNQEPRILLLGPSHHVYFPGLAACSAKEWATPLGTVTVDPLNETLVTKHPEVVSLINEAHREEHCLEVQLPFLQAVLPSFSIVPLLTGEGDPDVFAKTLNTVISDLDLIVASSDLSHYYPYETAVKLDQQANEAVPKLDIDRVAAEVEACGKTGILTLLHLARMNRWRGCFVDYKNSGDTAGDKSAVVGYGCYAFFAKP